MAETPDTRRDTLGLLTAFYNATRSEILQRQTIRESTLTLFLGASATLAGVSLTGTDARRWLLFFIPILGLGASCVYIQHTTATRALWTYLATEFQEEVSRVMAPEQALRHWDVSHARAGLAKSAAVRAAASTVLIVVPGLLAAVGGLVSIGFRLGAVVAFIISLLAASTSALLVGYGFRLRPVWYASPRADVADEATP
ncbi:hypothetical protein KBX26_15270 [Micromonospora sp. C97]|uniref:hypothetical protein n=1 Tax=Micromonospora sp. C97 TaxID=2824883 RepID=UPI001B38C731|nr:hypothetical protein [Micromonospora sp. C97]MBQ1031353.1 hypothetical protein [Micromonospora sp. C97]